MNTRRLVVSIVALGAWFATLPLAHAHRLDEYLQATRLSVELNTIDVEMDLTAGEAIASKVFSWIDTDHDGEISKAEGAAYARQVLSSVALLADGKAVPLALTEAHFPELREMSQGTGMIRLRAVGRMPATAAGRHEISFRNNHRPESSVYLVNALVPANPRIQIADQQRDHAQHTLLMSYMVAPGAPPLRGFALITGLALAGRWYLRKRRPL
jgi:nickel/cobalt transporter (NicO) family protein